VFSNSNSLASAPPDLHACTEPAIFRTTAPTPAGR
jgi:hypothetical protein